MKRTGKLALISMAIVFTLSVFAANFFVPLKSASAAFEMSNAYVMEQAVGSGASNWQSEYELGQAITDIPQVAGAYLLIKEPGGTVVLDGRVSGTVTTSYMPEYSGYYTAVYVNDAGKPVTRDFRFHVSAEDYEIDIPYNGADIPTFVAKTGKVPLPVAQIIYTDARGEVKTLLDADKKPVAVTVAAEGSKGILDVKTDTDGSKYVSPEDGGKIFITYSYGIGGKLYIQKNFTVTIEDNFKDVEDPTINVNISSTNIPLMTKVTLPSGTATDDKDTNVKVTVSVKAPDGSSNAYTVKDYMLDEDSGFILDKYKDKTSTDYYVNAANKVEFDNRRNMTFYPDQKGAYEIKYTAFDDVGKTREATITLQVEDTAAPFINVKQSKIPAEWANKTLTKLVNGVEKTYNNAGTDSDKFNLYFPKNDFIDNVSLLSEMSGGTVEFKKDATVIDSITYPVDATYPNGKFTSSNGIIKEDSDKNMLYVPGTYKLDTGADYTINYIATDTAASQRNSNKSFVVKIVAELKDIENPKIEFKDTVNTIKTGATFTKPTVTASDNKGTADLDVRYVLSNRIDRFNEYIEAEGDIDFTESDLFYKDAIDKFDPDAIEAGALAAGYNKILIQATATDGVGNTVTEVKRVDIVNTKTAAEAPVITEISNVSYYDTDENKVVIPEITNKLDFDKTASAKTDFTIGSITVTQAGTDTYLGYEFAIRNSAGDIVGIITESTSWLTYSDEGLVTAATTLNISNFNFTTPNKADDYTIMLSVFNVSGATVSVTFNLKVEAIDEWEVGRASSYAIVELPATLEYGRALNLPNYYAQQNGVISYDPDKIYKKTIIGPHYSMSGSELTAYMTGEYTVILAADYAKLPRYESSFEVNDTVGPTVRLTGVIPTVSTDVTKTVYIPNFTASDISGIDQRPVSRTVTVKNGGTTIDAEEVTADDGAERAGMLKFTPFTDGTKIDGKYTITYTAADNNGQSASLIYYIDVGDVFSPVITLNDGKDYATTMKLKAKFYFLNYDATDEAYVKNSETGAYVFTSGINLRSKVKVTLTAPDGSTPYEFSTTITGKSPASQDAYVLDKAGVYTVTYTVSDEAGNETKLVRKITVEEKSKTKVINEKVLTVILVTAGVLVIAGVVFYFVRYRRKV